MGADLRVLPVPVGAAQMHEEFLDLVTNRCREHSRIDAAGGNIRASLVHDAVGNHECVVTELAHAGDEVCIGPALGINVPIRVTRHAALRHAVRTPASRTCPHRIRHTPPSDCFKPAGIPLRDLREITLAFDEMEAARRLADHEDLYNIDAATRMGVSLQTFDRIVRRARREIAEALALSQALRVFRPISKKSPV